MKKLKKNLWHREPGVLAPYAMKAKASRGRKFKEAEPVYRTSFQRDRDRILYSTAFRRLQYKTQVFVNHEGDHFRTRLTHTLETAQISQTIGRALGLNEDLISAIALGHDLGHGPFGHAGEWALAEKMKDHGGFEHNIQCIRIVEKLESSYTDFQGLNLSFETLEGLKKHPERFYKNRTQRFRTLEADVVDIGDEIAYCSHDLDDGLRSQYIREEQLQGLEIWDEALEHLKGRPPMPAPQHRKFLIRIMTDRMVSDIIENTAENIEKSDIDSLESLQKTPKRIAAFSPVMIRKHAALKRFLMKNLYQHYVVIRMTDKGQRFINALFDAYLHKPKLLPPEVLNWADKEGLHRAVCDYLAGMTDRFAVDEYKRLFEPYEKVS